MYWRKLNSFPRISFTLSYVPKMFHRVLCLEVLPPINTLRGSGSGSAHLPPSDDVQLLAQHPAQLVTACRVVGHTLEQLPVRAVLLVKDWFALVRIVDEGV